MIVPALARDPALAAAVDALIRFNDADRADVLSVQAAWPTPPAAVRAGILAMVEAAEGGNP